MKSSSRSVGEALRYNYCCVYILSEVYRTLQSLDSNHHLFCPKQHDDDDSNYEDIQTVDDSISPGEKLRLVNDAKERQNTAYQFCLVFAFSADDVGEWQQEHLIRLTNSLTRCDRCVRNYHRGRKQFLKALSE